MALSTETHVGEDVWIPTSCGQCYCMCGIRVRKQDGVVTEVAGNPAAPRDGAISASKDSPRRSCSTTHIA